MIFSALNSTANTIHSSEQPQSLAEFSSAFKCLYQRRQYLLHTSTTEMDKLMLKPILSFLPACLYCVKVTNDDDCISSNDKH